MPAGVTFTFQAFNTFGLVHLDISFIISFKITCLVPVRSLSISYSHTWIPTLAPISRIWDHNDFRDFRTPHATNPRLTLHAVENHGERSMTPGLQSFLVLCTSSLGRRASLQDIDHRLSLPKYSVIE
jgi:hypothetical protein